MNQKGYWVMQCRDCGKWSVREIRKSVLKAMFICRYCNKKFNINTKKRYGLNLNYINPVDDPNVATLKCQKLNKALSNQ